MSFSVISSYLIQHPVLTALLIAHFLSDFTFQSQALADDKKLHLKALFMHPPFHCFSPSSYSSLTYPRSKRRFIFSSLAEPSCD